MNKLQHLQYLGKLGNQGKVAITDSDARTYISAVETADNQSLEFSVKVAIQNFIIGAKVDGIWNAIKSSAILAGARTLNGALVPLKGTAPTNFNFVAGDYDRKTGLKGDGSTKYLNSNRNNNADPQNSSHITVYVTQQQTGSNCLFIGSPGLGPEFGINHIGIILTATPNYFFIRNRLSNALQLFNPQTGFVGHSRPSSSTFTTRNGGTNSSFLGATSLVPEDNLIGVFGSPGQPSANARLSFYSIGEAIDLALLDTRVTKLMTDLGNAIP